MDDTTLAALEGALGASPGNAALRLVIASARLDRGEPRQALDALGDVDQPDALLLGARACLALGRPEEAMRRYHGAVSRNAALEDPALEASIESAAERNGDAAGRDDRDSESDNDGADGSDDAGASDGENGDGSRLRLVSGGRLKASDESVTLAFEPRRARVTFADVGGLAAVKEQIRKRIILPFLKPSLFERFKRRAGGGILLYGPPGCGKTLLARATAGECDAAFFDVAISDILDMYIGESEAKLHAIFEKARASTPAVLFFDEIEALGGKRDSRHDSAGLRLVSQFLAEMDGFAQANAGVLVLAATNLPWGVDPAFRRPGRFDRVLFVPPPDREARRAILEIHLRDRPVDPRVDADVLAGRTPGFSGADLLGLVDEAADSAIAESIASGAERPIQPRHVDEALKAVKPTTLEWLTTARNHARYANEGGQYDEVLEFLRRHGKD